MSDSIKVVVLSDTHGVFNNLTVPEGDILIHAGDLTSFGNIDQVEQGIAFLESLPHEYKLFVPGNHDFPFEEKLYAVEKFMKTVIYLQDKDITIKGIKFYGTAWQPPFGNMAFNIDSEAERAEKWKLIPDDTEFLITHTPPFNILDGINAFRHVGCKALTERVGQIQPKVHVFGHIHEAYGSVEQNGTLSVNASIHGKGGNDKDPVVLVKNNGTWSVE